MGFDTKLFACIISSTATHSPCQYQTANAIAQGWIRVGVGLGEGPVGLDPL